MQTDEQQIGSMRPIEDAVAPALPGMGGADPYQFQNDTGSDLSHRTYVGNLSWDVTWTDLKDHMCNDSVLFPFDETKIGEIVLITDASSVGAGCLMAIKDKDDTERPCCYLY